MSVSSLKLRCDPDGLKDDLENHIEIEELDMAEQQLQVLSDNVARKKAERSNGIVPWPKTIQRNV